MKRDNFFLQLVKCYLNLFFSFIMCFMLSMTLMVFQGYSLITYVVQIFTIAIMLLLLGNYAWTDGKKEIKLMETYKLAPISPFRWWGLGLLTTLPFYVLLGGLVLDKLGFIKGLNFGVVYRLLATQFMPIVIKFARPAPSVEENVTNIVTANDYPWWLIVVLAVLPLLIPLTMGIVHKLSVKDEISTDTIVYKDIK